MIDQAYNRRSWHGTNLRGSLRGVTAKEAAWRPHSGRHNIWELVLHAAYWKYAVHRRLTGARMGSFALKGSNWITRPRAEMTEAQWKKDVRLLDDTHRALRSAVASLKPGAISKNRFRLTGIAAHDLYHAGQIQLLKRLVRGR